MGLLVFRAWCRDPGSPRVSRPLAGPWSPHWLKIRRLGLGLVSCNLSS